MCSSDLVTTGHPVVVLLVVVVCLGALTIPGLGLRTALPNSEQHTEGAPDHVTLFFKNIRFSLAVLGSP